MQLAVIGAVVFTAICAVPTYPPDPGVPPWYPSAIAHLRFAAWVLALGMAWCGQAYSIATTIRNWQADIVSGRRLRKRNWLENHADSIWLVVNMGLVYSLGMAEWTASSLVPWIGRMATPQLSLMASMTFAPLILAWSSEYDLHIWANRLSSTLGTSQQPTRSQFVVTRLRQALLPVFLPVFAVTSLGDLGHGFGVSPGGSPFVSSGLALGGLVLLGMGLPWLLKWCWGCRPIEDPHLRSQLDEWCRQFGVPVREICLWPTQGQILNAVVCGILPGFRMIFLTDRLIQELTRDQLRCVLAHEFAHIRQRHALRQMAIIAVPVLGWAAFLPPTTIGPLATGLLLVTLLAPLLAWTGRLAEHEADFSACLLLSWTGDAGLRPAVERYIQMLVALHGPPPHPTWHWLHPPLSARKRFLARLDRPQVSPSRYLRGQRIGLWTAVLLVAFAVPFLVRSNSPGTVAITRVVRSSSGKWAQVTASCHRPASNPSPILVVLEQSNFELSAAV